ncbi:hypothetical protein DERF_004083 [Dermatophagoides farinae]|uniref:Uncharacterized protein n=1 Tax=Dermatophagoides farinae TaxID=6954 RepID=A0A922IGK5_DERFA|nr:hypothetical protein DERF_004083 [Dermatophagoides farinae]
MHMIIICKDLSLWMDLKNNDKERIYLLRLNHRDDCQSVRKPGSKNHHHHQQFSVKWYAN